MTDTVRCSKHGRAKAYYPSDRAARCSRCATEAVAKRRKKLKLQAIAYKGGKCTACGYDKSARALQFHHPNRRTKSFGISARGFTRSWKKLKAELDKCVLMCANCHAEEHGKD